jgi:hypothetical protein
MTTWGVVRYDDSGTKVSVAAYGSRVPALAAALALNCSDGDQGVFRVDGPPSPAFTTNRDLYLHLLGIGRNARRATWSLSAYLRGLWRVSTELRDRREFSLDDAAAMFSAALAVPPPPFDPAWATADFRLRWAPTRCSRDDGDPAAAEPSRFDHWERILLSQIADLEDFAANPPGEQARFGVNAPRPRGVGRRATPVRWLNFDPATYLECAAAGHLGGWDVADGARVPLPARDGTTMTRSHVRQIAVVGWADLVHMAVCGQTYE